jgi:hypothetical protein
MFSCVKLEWKFNSVLRPPEQDTNIYPELIDVKRIFILHYTFPDAG